jgi:hypothetical protein
VFIVVDFFFFFAGGGDVSLPRDLCWFILGWLGEYHVTLGAYLFGLPNVSQAGLELVSGGGSSPPIFSV